ncbi:MAG: 4Fe-4S binding protein [Bacilli bacterium]|nr:4Fe-4S binding protein [Bacilli bacterium]
MYGIDKNKCISCGKCFSVCPQKCINIDLKKISENNCLRCGTCFEICPQKAVTME